MSSQFNKKYFLVSVYYYGDEDKFIIDKNDLTLDDYDYNKCISKVIRTHLDSVNSSDIEVFDVAIDREYEQINNLVNQETGK